MCASEARVFWQQVHRKSMNVGVLGLVFSLINIPGFLNRFLLPNVTVDSVISTGFHHLVLPPPKKKIQNGCLLPTRLSSWASFSQIFRTLFYLFHFVCPLFQLAPRWPPDPGAAVSVSAVVLLVPSFPFGFFSVVSAPHFKKSLLQS